MPKVYRFQELRYFLYINHIYCKRIKKIVINNIFIDIFQSTYLRNNSILEF
jgi:hypothetical protein